MPLIDQGSFIESCSSGMWRWLQAGVIREDFWRGGIYPAWCLKEEQEGYGEEQGRTCEEGNFTATKAGLCGACRTWGKRGDLSSWFGCPQTSLSGFSFLLSPWPSSALAPSPTNSAPGWSLGRVNANSAAHLLGSFIFLLLFFCLQLNLILHR